MTFRMTFRRLLLIALMAVPAVPSVAASDDRPLIRSLADAAIVPAYRRFAAAMDALADATADYCAAPNPATRRTLEAAFGVGLDAWQEAQPVDFGPVLENSRYSRIQFWPDKGGIAARQLRQALQKRDPALVAPDGLKGRSVALQNLSAYERLLFDGPQTAPYACALAAAIARFQAEQSEAILGEWQGPYQATLNDPAHASEIATAMFKSIFSTLDRIIAFKLERPLDKSLKAAKPKRSESWRSGRSLRNIAANLRMAKRLYATEGGFGDRLAAGGSAALDTGLRRSFDELIARVGAVGMPLSAAVADPTARPKLEKILTDLKDLRILISGPVAEELGIVIGFNAQDGD